VTDADRARVWLWAAYWAGHEEDTLVYGYPRMDGWEDRSARFASARRASFERAAKLLGGNVTDGDWKDAVETFSNPYFSR
jgi:hypothetical protein